MPSLEQIKQYLISTVIPPVAGILATWLTVHVHFLATFHITSTSVAGALTQLGIWGVTTLTVWLSTHNILKGLYTPEAKAKIHS